MTTTSRATSTTTRTATATGTVTTIRATVTTTKATEPSTTTSRDIDVSSTNVSSMASIQTSTPPSTSSEALDTSPTALPDTAAPSEKQNNTALIGGVVGGIIFLLVIIAIAFVLLRRKRKRGSRFKLLRWRCPRMELEQSKLEAGSIPSTTPAQTRPPSTAIGSAVPVLQPPTSTAEDPSPVISPLQAHEITSPHTSRPNISPDSRTVPFPSLTTDCPTPTIPSYPAAVHPAFRNEPNLDLSLTALTMPTPIDFKQPLAAPLTKTDIKTKTLPPAPTPIHPLAPELPDTGFWLRRQELPPSPTRNPINIPFLERLRQKQQKQLARSAGPSTSIVTSDGAVLSANFTGFPASEGAGLAHAMSFMNYDPGSPVESKPASLRSESGRRSLVKEMVKERFRRKS
ncbi:hypothetical protein BJY04DRAFT_216907 [Aspergillus karnatakaensis]|uniref:uncharacterized protein n=1 Tax=Aspergillus karnatakaensis TaxID=1810916 RepID=UPI003CCD7061